MPARIAATISANCVGAIPGPAGPTTFAGVNRPVTVPDCTHVGVSPVGSTNSAVWHSQTLIPPFTLSWPKWMCAIFIYI